MPKTILSASRRSDEFNRFFTTRRTLATGDRRNLKRTKGKDKKRQGTFFTANFTCYSVISLCIRRYLNQNQVINWIISVYRWFTHKLELKVVVEGRLTHARKRLGVKVFREFLHKLIGETELPIDCHGRSTIGDGTTSSMLDTPENRETL